MRHRLALMMAVATPALAASDPRGLPHAWRAEDADADADARDVTLADVDADGRLDLLLTAPTTDGLSPGRVVVVRDASTWAGVPTEIVGADDGHPARWSEAPGAFGDVDGDGYADQLTWRGDAAARDRTLQLRRGGPSGLAPDAAQVAVDDASVPWFHGDKVPTGPLVDADGDGYADALLRSFDVRAGDRSGQLSWHAGSPAGLTLASAWREDVGGRTFVDLHPVVVGDVDRDGYRDLIEVTITTLGDVDAASMQLTRGDADGFRDAWWASFALPDEATRLEDVHVLDAGDLSGDGLADVIVVISPTDPALPASAWVFEGDDHFGFTLNSPTRLWLAPSPGPARPLGLGDVDGDAHPDLVIARPDAPSPAGGVGVIDALMHVRTSTYAAALSWHAEAGEARLGWRGAVGDVDGDGHDDLVALLSVDGAPATALLPGFADADLDGWDDDVDCRPLDPAAHPGADEVWYDGVDQDCDGNDDDQDGDGTPAPADCADDDAAVNPDATEVWYDGVDQDCDGRDDDRDGDGALRADDCDDDDARRFPDAVDAPGDGVDQDCDGVDADAQVVAPPPTGCACAAGPAAPTALWLVLLVGAARRRRR